MAARRTERRSTRFQAPGRIHHVAIVVRSLDGALPLYRDLLGMSLETIMDIPTDRVRIAFLGVGQRPPNAATKGLGFRVASSRLESVSTHCGSGVGCVALDPPTRQAPN